MQNFSLVCGNKTFNFSLTLIQLSNEYSEQHSMKPHNSTWVNDQRTSEVMLVDRCNKKLFFFQSFDISTQLSRSLQQKAFFSQSIYISTHLFTAIYFTFMFVGTQLLASNEHVTREDFGI